MSTKDHIEDFISSPDINGCCKWLRCHTKERPIIDINGKTTLVYRFLMAEKLGRVLGSDELVCHSCDNGWCVALDHLWLGTHQDNVNDKMNKGRHQNQFSNFVPAGKITEDEARDIKKDKRPTKEIMKDYPLSRWAINDIKSGRTWRHL